MDWFKWILACRGPWPVGMPEMETHLQHIKRFGKRLYVHEYHHHKSLNIYSKSDFCNLESHYSILRGIALEFDEPSDRDFWKWSQRETSPPQIKEFYLKFDIFTCLNMFIILRLIFGGPHTTLAAIFASLLLLPILFPHLLSFSLSLFCFRLILICSSFNSYTHFYFEHNKNSNWHNWSPQKALIHKYTWTY